MPIRWLRRVVALVPAWLAASGSLAFASEETLRVFDTCWKHVRSLPRASSREDIPWRDLKREYRPRADAATSDEDLRAVLNEMLGEVGISHTAVLGGSIYGTMMREIHGRPTPTFGLLLEEMEPGRLFVRAQYEKGPAERAGLRLGDEIVAVDGVPPLRSELVVDAGYDPRPGSPRLFTLEPQPPGEQVELRVRSTAQGRTRRARIVSEETSGLEAGHRSVRVIERDGLRIGVVHLWLVSRGSSELVQSALRGKLAKCDAVVVDLRGRGGLSDEIAPILAPFREASRVRGKRRVTWRRPVVFLIDDRTRSAKEITAWYAREEKLGPIVGERTEGAVLGATFVPLPGDHWMELGAIEVPVADGSSLEGVGVKPTHPVRRLGPYANGVDPILERGLDLAVERASRKGLRGPY